MSSSSPAGATTPKTPTTATTTTTTTTKRRSARVHKRDPIVAPGFGTHKDLTNLSSSLGLPLVAVQAIMESRGRGIRGSKRGATEEDNDNKDKAPPTPVSHAWADFMMEEGMGDEEQNEAPASNDSKRAATATTTTTSTKKSAQAAAAASRSSSSSSSKSGPREYALPLVPEWWNSKSSSSSSSHASKKTKTTSTTSTPVVGSSSQRGVLVQTGTLDANMIGRTKRTLDQPYDLLVPTIILPPLKLKVIKVIASCNAAHSLCFDTNGHVHGWGRNDAHQLSASLPSPMVPLPTRLQHLSTTAPIVNGAVGKSHTILLDQDMTLHAVGANKMGQCGINSSTESVINFRKCPLDAKIVQVSCGEQFSVALSDEGRLYTTGLSEFGQLGNGSTGEYFIAANKMGFANCTSFTLRSDFVQEEGNTHTKQSSNSDNIKLTRISEDIRIGYIACGKNHTTAMEASSSTDDPTIPPPRIFSWGCGNYGCLGHGQQKDEYVPRLITTLSSGPIWQSNPPVKVAAGSNCSLVLTKRGHVYYCGRHRTNMEAVMRPSLLDVLANNGHVVTHVAAGSQTVVCSTVNAVTVSWGQGPHGELGYGDKKSSAKPAFVPALEKCRLLDLACGQGTTLFVVADEDKEDKAAIQSLAIFDAKDAAPLESKE